MAHPNLLEIRKETISVILDKYKRTEKSLEEDVTVLKNWMKSQPHLPEILDDKSIQNFFILNKCSVERTKRSIDMYYTLRSKIPEVYENINPKSLQIREEMEIEACVPLAKQSKDLHRILVYKTLNKTLIEKLDAISMARIGLNLQEIRLKEDVMHGDIIVFDMDGVSFGYFAKMTPSDVAKVFVVYEKVFSIPMKGLYLVNCPPFVSSVVGILKGILKPKLFNRIHVCEDTSILTKTFPLEILPKDYGGFEKSVAELNDLMKIKLSQYQTRFDELDKLRVDEKLRPEKLKNDEMLGFYGNFKKLDVD